MADNVLSRDDLRPIAQLAAMLPDPPSSATLWRWHALGVAGVRLKTVRIGGRRYSTPRAFNRFVEAVTAASSVKPLLSVDSAESSEKGAAQ